MTVNVDNGLVGLTMIYTHVYTSALRLRIFSSLSAITKWNKLHVVVSDTEVYHLPICEINPNRSLLSTLHNFMTEIFGTDVAPHKPHGLLAVEFSGDCDGDGLCLSLLVSFKLPVEEVPIIGKYSWYQVPENIAEGITVRLPRNMTVPLNVVR